MTKDYLDEIGTETTAKMLDDIRNGVHFSWSRWGDGEWGALLGDRSIFPNTDKHPYYEDLGARLREIILSDPPYLLSLQKRADEMYRDNQEYKKIKSKVKWGCSNERLQWLNAKSRLKPFFEALKDRYVVMVSRQEVCDIKQIDVTHKVVIPCVDCWSSYLKTRGKLMDFVNIGDVVLYGASMMSNVLIDDLYRVHRDTITQIDCGSTLDPHVGLMSRRNYRTQEWAGK